MKLVEVFKGVIWSIQYTGDDRDIFTIRMSQWRDAEYLEDFIHRHKGFIHNDPFWKGYTVADVIVSAKKDAHHLLKYIIKLYNNTLQGLRPDLSDRFVIMENPPYSASKEARRKLYGRDRDASCFTGPNTVLRLYAIRLDSKQKGEKPAFVITGGGIKLSAKMPQMRELNQEYGKMLSVQEWLAKQGLATKESLFTLKYNHDE